MSRKILKGVNVQNVQIFQGGYWLPMRIRFEANYFTMGWLDDESIYDEGFGNDYWQEMRLTFPELLLGDGQAPVNYPYTRLPAFRFTP